MAHSRIRRPKEAGTWRKMVAAVHIAFDRMRICRRCRLIAFAPDKKTERRCPVCGGGRVMDRPTKFEYRRRLKDWTGRSSCAEMTIGHLADVLDELRKMGFAAETGKSLAQAAADDGAEMIEALELEAENILGPDWRKRLRSFCGAKIGKSNLEDLDLTEIRRVWGFLRGVQKGGRHD